MGMTLQIEDHTGELKSLMDVHLKNAFEEIGQIAEAYAKTACPVDTGRLRNSISHEAKDREVQVGTNVEYAPYIELGTSRKQAQPFLRPSIENYIEKYKSIIVNELNEIG